MANRATPRQSMEATVSVPPTSETPPATSTPLVGKLGCTTVIGATATRVVLGHVRLQYQRSVAR
ncbi:hypothetical protein [Candidatus Phyllobacterium onerii]|uniref:hypothetical protein n=1 Tax=Candidatus Phyllobacterium onerii TaxID=3020828 RepID=UPI00232B8CC2|nr:hypothetical protein [Phyllobacterium sp. IY22]